MSAAPRLLIERSGTVRPDSDHAAEQAVLGAMMLEPVAPQKLDAAMFSDQRNRAIYRAATALLERSVKVDPITLRAELEQAGQLDQAGGLDYIATLIDAVPTAANIDHHAGIVRRHAARRSLATTLETLRDGNLSPEAIDAAEDTVKELWCALRDCDSAPSFSPPVLKDFVSNAPADVTWVAKPVAARDAVTVFAGHPKTGKTTFLASLAGANAVMASFIGQPTEGGPVLWIDLEQPQGLTASVLKAHCLESSLVYVQWGTLPNLDAAGEFCQRQQINLVVVDSWTKARQGVEDANDEVQTERALQPWLDFARKYHVAVVFIHHLRKSGGAEGLDLRGSGALAQTADIVVVFKRFAPDSDSDSRRVIEVFSRYGASKTVIELIDGKYQACGTPGQVRRQGERDKVLAVLTNQWQTAAEVAHNSDLTAAAARTVLNMLATSEAPRLVERSGTGRKGDPYKYVRTPE